MIILIIDLIRYGTRTLEKGENSVSWCIFLTRKYNDWNYGRDFHFRNSVNFKCFIIVIIIYGGK